jgi:hypothetical protein
MHPFGHSRSQKAHIPGAEVTASAPGTGECWWCGMEVRTFGGYVSSAPLQGPAASVRVVGSNGVLRQRTRSMKEATGRVGA